jgi:hypothetical protein
MWPAIRWPPGCPTVRRTRNEHRVPVLGCANDGASSGPIPISDPLGVFAGNQLDPMDHLGTRQFLFMGCSQADGACSGACRSWRPGSA